MIAAAESWGLGDSLLAMLKDAQVVARGPKASAAVHQAGVPVAARAESERMDELINMLIAIGVEGRTVAFQRHGDDSPETIASLRAAGARVIEIPVYRWILPLDVGPAQSLIQSLLDAKLQAVTFTSAPAVRNLFLIAAELGCVDDVRSSLNSSVIPVTVGPVCAAAASDAGVKSPLVPDRYRIGPMIRTLTDELLDRGIRATIGGTPASICGNDLRLGQRLINLSGREAALLASLLAVAPRVISKTDLLNKVWGGETDPHVIEVTVARLRRRLGDHGVFIQVVPRRGYLVQR
jgi:uroporphyrinogen-III synthase